MKLILLDFAKSMRKLDILYVTGEVSSPQWSKLYDALLDNYEKKLRNYMRKEKV